VWDGAARVVKICSASQRLARVRIDTSAAVGCHRIAFIGSFPLLLLFLPLTPSLPPSLYLPSLAGCLSKLQLVAATPGSCSLPGRSPSIPSSLLPGLHRTWIDAAPDVALLTTLPTSTKPPW